MYKSKDKNLPNAIADGRKILSRLFYGRAPQNNRITNYL